MHPASACDVNQRACRDLEKKMTRMNTTIGDLVQLFYAEYMAIYGDEELASIATAATINDLLIERAERSAEQEREEDAA
jgi:hypothetical protein